MTKFRPYRPCVGVMLLNQEGLVFVGNRIDTPGDHWQMPQGGIDPGEDPRAAAFRELYEETGVDNAIIIREASRPICYDLPPELSTTVWGGQYRGQEQRWFAMQFLGDDSDIKLDLHEREFSAWRWMAMNELVDNIVPFKRATYEEVLAEFSALMGES
ncbi:MAG: RNA pyrophosphohydrolase [Rhodospirillaceae bacterium]|nr:RNA pyrophosphohydrolase [Rhodospirillaceae bacterium]